MFSCTSDDDATLVSHSGCLCHRPEIQSLTRTNRPRCFTAQRYRRDRNLDRFNCVVHAQPRAITPLLRTALAVGPVYERSRIRWDIGRPTGRA